MARSSSESRAGVARRSRREAKKGTAASSGGLKPASGDSAGVGRDLRIGPSPGYLVLRTNIWKARPSHSVMRQGCFTHSLES